MIQKTQRSLRRLDEIALKPNPLTELEYIDLLIESEKQEAKFGWQERVKYYQGAREFAITLANTKDATGIEKEENIKEWAKKLISKLKDDKIQQLERLTAKTKDSTPLSGVENFGNEIVNLLNKPQ
ncbi:MAG: hypothetical protein F6K40_34855 [Okeania sp. SIO3I5]|uniref:hypothetical protein n=1 Tax=Okeania sp. SIO3I5 TaxID=2607805 RepID=UPI0013BDD05B|nr:hypothetical protein [Okeania sp. SIO3I5]NEQ41112.1 hypothetical protein [Okeania sp. SIO3I5]